MELEQLFTQREKEEISRFFNNPIMFKAVKKVLLSAIYFDGTIQKDGISNKNFLLNIVAENKTASEIGEKVGASIAATQILEQGFRRLQYFDKKKVEQKTNTINPAR